MTSNILFLVVGIFVLGIVALSFIYWRKSKDNRINGFLSLAGILLSAIFGLCSIVAWINPQFLTQGVMPETADLYAQIDSLEDEKKHLQEENKRLLNENNELSEQINDMESVQNTEEKREKINLLENPYFDQSESNSFIGFADVDGGKDNGGVIHGKGFIYIGDYYQVGYRTYELNSLYKTIKGTIALPFDNRDTKGKCSVRILDENENILYSGEEITGGADSQEFDINVEGIDKIKFEFIITEGSIQVGVYDVMAY